MEQSKRNEFIRKFAEGASSDTDHEAFAQWVKNASQEELAEAWAVFSGIEGLQEDHEQPSAAFRETLERRLDQIDRPQKLIRFRLVAVAASIFAIAGISWFYLWQNDQPKDVKDPSPVVAAKEDFNPGSNKAILTLSDGRKISLDDSPNGSLAQESGVSVKKNRNGQLEYTVTGAGSAASDTSKLNTISTPRGGYYQVNLPDGSKAWLNAASSLTFPVNFTGTHRKVQVTGEAWFDVMPDKKKPFIVQSDAQELEVLGTQFNINTYEQNAITTSLTEGSVKLNSSASGDIVKLKPGQQAVLDKQAFSVGKFDVENVSAWRKGLFSYTNASLYTIMKDFERWYDAEVIYEGSMPNINFTGQISRSMKASKFLEILSSYSLQFKLETVNNKQKLVISAN